MTDIVERLRDWHYSCETISQLTCDAITEIERLRAEITDLKQTSGELCPKCGWRMIVPGDGCLNCDVSELRAEVAANREAKAAARERMEGEMERLRAHARKSGRL